MAKKEPLLPSPKLLSVLKEFQAIATMSGFVNHVFDPPQLRLMFTLYGRIRHGELETHAAIVPQLQTWGEKLSLKLKEDSSNSIIPPQIQISTPQPIPDGGYATIATLSFNTKVTDNSYLKVRTAVLAAYQEAVRLREEGFPA